MAQNRRAGSARALCRVPTVTAATPAGAGIPDRLRSRSGRGRACRSGHLELDEAERLRAEICGYCRKPAFGRNMATKILHLEIGIEVDNPVVPGELLPVGGDRHRG